MGLRLGSWQRLGIVASVFWVTGAGLACLAMRIYNGHQEQKLSELSELVTLKCVENRWEQNQQQKMFFDFLHRHNLRHQFLADWCSEERLPWEACEARLAEECSEERRSWEDCQARMVVECSVQRLPWKACEARTADKCSAERLRWDTCEASPGLMITDKLITSPTECFAEGADVWREHISSVRHMWKLEVATALMPIPIAWLLAYMITGVWRWVRRGFARDDSR